MFNKPTNPDQLRRLRVIQIIADLILIAIIIFISFYVIKNVELLKTLNGDVCKFCMEKTGATCMNLQFKP